MALKPTESIISPPSALTASLDLNTKKIITKSNTLSLTVKIPNTTYVQKC